MTPKAFIDQHGAPFPTTSLDRRAGVKSKRENYVLAEPGASVPLLSEAVFQEVKRHADQGASLMEAGKYREAFDAYVEALQLLPDPIVQWNAGAWLLVAMGENAIRAGNYKAALDPLEDAMYGPGTVGNPWVHLRLGMVHFELDHQKAAADHLARAYMGGGRDVFQGLDPKYFGLLERVLKPPPGKTRLD